ncbi:MAG: dihydrofolate reductase [Bacteroidales bacterium]|jgi:dihydrofolate reductase|nr:dihydrofolate reductase [Bacteroidales bacterium]
MYKNLFIIVALGRNNEIGRENSLLTHLPRDMKRFKLLTLDTTVIMGENTYHSLQVKPLPKRRNIVLSFDPTHRFPDCEMAYSIDEALTLALKDDRVFVIGGASVYRQFLPLVSRLYLTKINAAFDEADAFFPDIDFSQWNLQEEEVCSADEKHRYDYSFCIYDRIQLSEK